MDYTTLNDVLIECQKLINDYNFGICDCDNETIEIKYNKELNIFSTIVREIVHCYLQNVDLNIVR